MSATRDAPILRAWPRPARRGWRLAARAFWLRRSAAAGACVVGVVVAAALLAPWIAPHDPTQHRLLERLQPPGLGAHLLGTDNFGRDQLARLVYGARVSLLVGVVSVVIAAGLGAGCGLLGGYYGGRLDTLLMRVVDVLMAFPLILLAIAIVAVLGGGLFNLMLAVGVSSIPPFARLVRGEVLAQRSRDYVEAARALGAAGGRVMGRHILPNTLSPIIVLSTLRVSTVILTESSLSFLGLGVAPPTPTWGNMVADGTKFLQTAPWISIVPGVAIMLTVLAFNLFGDGLRDALDPRLKGEIGLPAAADRVPGR
ncbi:MAG: ABC transporter permease [Armatimonadota bacterium]|nr:ABC transporter permease [Armatimonadota bacterium]